MQAEPGAIPFARLNDKKRTPNLPLNANFPRARSFSTAPRRQDETLEQFGFVRGIHKSLAFSLLIGDERNWRYEEAVV
jgi:hypothetical protein